MLWSVWLATCPRFSPFTIAKAPIWCTNLSATRIIIRLVEVIVYLGCTTLFTCFCNSVNGTICNLIGPTRSAKIRVNSITFSFAWSLVNGGLWKWIASIVTPRLITSIPATGESIPPESISNVLPPVPTGNPPEPGTTSSYI